MLHCLCDIPDIPILTFENLRGTAVFILLIFLPKTKPILIGILYRPPKQRRFLNNLSEALGNIPNLNSREIYIY